ncbi:hypothetical protein [Halochromatium roseum]|uniref:hypothetical protein n=1 Tax=Halochromatium roseum TaxID=391920 RepID=UPI001911BE19|nr:hypothetical protein [Halochromatium roseum]MBK5940043.1 hypothetical protein [Halochromatium roseum]
MFERYLHFSHYQSIVKDSRMRRPKRTRSIINPHPNLDFASSTRDLIRKLGQPSLKLSPQNTSSEQLYLYRREISGYKVNFEFHLHEDQLYYTRHIFRHTSAKETELIIKAIGKKYSEDATFNDRQDKIIDQQGNELIINRGLYLSIDYLYAQGTTLREFQAPEAVYAMA